MASRIFAPRLTQSHREIPSAGYDFASGVHKYLYEHGDPVNGVDPSGHGFNLISSLKDSGLGAAIGGLSAATADYAHGRSITVASGAPGCGVGCASWTVG